MLAIFFRLLRMLKIDDLDLVPEIRVFSADMGCCELCKMLDGTILQEGQEPSDLSHPNCKCGVEEW